MRTLAGQPPVIHGGTMRGIFSVIRGGMGILSGDR